ANTTTTPATGTTMLKATEKRRAKTPGVPSLANITTAVPISLLPTATWSTGAGAGAARAVYTPGSRQASLWQTPTTGTISNASRTTPQGRELVKKQGSNPGQPG